MKRDKYIMSMMAAGLLLAASCTDFDDYNTADSSGATPESTVSLWENIQANENLSQFADILKMTGYDKELGNSRFYTVWAPQNDKFDYEGLKNQDKETVIQKFVKSHMANFNYTLNIDTTLKIHALNEKSFQLQGRSGEFTYDGKPISKRNIPNANGVLHILDGSAEYLTNLYEYIFEASGVDSIANFYRERADTAINRQLSVEGPIDEDGNQTYEDTVLTISNTLWGGRYANADLACEDSSYTMLLPTDKAFNNAFKAIKKCYAYPAKPDANTKAKIHYWKIDGQTGVFSDESGNVDDLLVGDSLVYRHIYQHAVFNNNEKYNRWVVDPSDPFKPLANDTIVTTRYYALSNGTEVLNDYMVGEPVKMSNGFMRIVDSLAMHPWETYNPDVNVPIYNNSYRPLIKVASVSSMNIAEAELDQKKGTELYRYLDVYPASTTSNPELYFYVPNVRSASYNVYIVTVPGNIKLKDSLYTPNQYKFEAQMNFAKADGAITAQTSSHKFSHLDDKGKSTNTFYSDSTKVDTIFLGRVDIPVSYVGVSGVYPYFMIKSTKQQWGTDKTNVDNHLRIAEIVMRPVDYDEHEPFITPDTNNESTKNEE